MSASKVILLNFILICFVLSVNGSYYFDEAFCRNVTAGIKSLTRVSEIPGRYTSEMCYNSTSYSDDFDYGDDYDYMYIHLELIKDTNEGQCHFKLVENTVYHSVLKTYTYDFLPCKVICVRITFDILVNGCYKTTLRILDRDFKPLPNNTFLPSYQYIKDSKNASFFNVQPSINIVYDRSNYIDITWQTGTIPVERFHLKLCHHKNYTSNMEFKDCAPVEGCRAMNSYTITCRDDRLSMFSAHGPKMLVFQHTEAHWEVGMFKEYVTAIYELEDDSFDTNGMKIINGTAYYLTANLTSPEETTSTIDTIEMSHSSTGEVKSGGSGVIISCVVITVLLVAVAVVIRTLHVRGYLQRYYHPSFRFLNLTKE